MRIISDAKSASNISISRIQEASNINDFMSGIYIACNYLNDWFVGNVAEISKQYNEIHIKLMKKNGKCFLWHTKDDPCSVPLFNCLGHVESLLVQGNRAYIYSWAQPRLNLQSVS